MAAYSPTSRIHETEKYHNAERTMTENAASPVMRSARTKEAAPWAIRRAEAFVRTVLILLLGLRMTQYVTWNYLYLYYEVRGNLPRATTDRAAGA